METRDWMNSAMALACGQWGWRPRDFWDATPLEFRMIMEGMRAMQRRDDGFDAGDVADLRRMIDREIGVGRY